MGYTLSVNKMRERGRERAVWVTGGNLKSYSIFDSRKTFFFYNDHRNNMNEYGKN